MIRKLLTALMCLTLALALPLGSLAATQTTLTVVPGSDLSQIVAAKDLLDVLSIKTVVGDEGAFAFGLGLSGEDVFNLAVRIAPEGVYADSAALTDKPMLFDWQNVKSFLEDAMKQAGTDEATAKQVSQSLDSLIATLNGNGQTTTIPNELLEKFTALGETITKDEKLTALFADVASRVKSTDGDYTAETHDPATRMTELTITSEDCIKLLDTDSAKAILDMFTQKTDKSGDKTLTTEEFIAKGKEFFASADMTTTIAAYTADEGAKLVSLSIPFAMKGELKTTEIEDGKEVEETETVDMQMPMTYDLLTVDGVENYTLGLSVISEGKTEITSRFRFNAKEDGSMNGVLGILADGSEMSLVLTKVKTADATNGEVALYIREDATALLEPAASDMPQLTLKVETKQTEGTELKAVETATEADATQPFKMTSDEQTAFVTDLSTRAQQLLYTILGKLPPSVLEGAGTVMQ